jgi:hypothetical protein
MSCEFNFHANIIDVVASLAAFVKLVSTVAALVEAFADVH